MPDSIKPILKYAVYLPLFYISVKYALPLIAPFIIGLGIAAIVQKPAELLSSRIPKLSRKVCCLIMTSGILFGTSAVIYLAVCSVLNGAVSFCPGIPAHLSRIKQYVAEASVAAEGAGTWGKFTAFAASGANRFMDFFSDNYREYLPSVLRRSTSLLSGLPSLLAGAAFTALSALFGCADYNGVKAGIKRLLPERAVNKASLIVKTSADTLSALMKAYGLLMLITFAELLTGLGIMSLAGYGTGSVVTAALVISIIDVLPVLGTGTVLIPWGIFEMLSGRTVSGIMLLVLFAVTEIVRNLLEPRLIAGRLELHPFFTLAGVYVGGRLFGAAGIFIMPLAMMIFRQLHAQKNGAAE